MSPAQFLDMDPVVPAKAGIMVLPLPWEGTVSYGRGTSKGPASILAASRQIESYEEELGWDLAEGPGIAVLDPIVPQPNEKGGDYHARIIREMAGKFPADIFPLGIGGDHSVTAAFMAGLGQSLEGLTVVHLDAHADLRPSYQGSPWSHACAMARVLDLGVERLISIGIRSASQEEARIAASDPRISTWWAHELHDSSAQRALERLLEELRQLEGPIWLTIDIDGLDVHLCPGTGTPMPGGLSWNATVAILKALLRESKAELRGADLCEVAPFSLSQVNETVAALLLRKLLAFRFAPRI